MKDHLNEKQIEGLEEVLDHLNKKQIEGLEEVLPMEMEEEMGEDSILRPL